MITHERNHWNNSDGCEREEENVKFLSFKNNWTRIILADKEEAAAFGERFGEYKNVIGTKKPKKKNRTH